MENLEAARAGVVETVPGERPQLILLTATIRPKPGTFALKRSSAEDRLADYVASARFYAGVLRAMPKLRIVFVENSAADVSDIVAVFERAGVSSRVEVVSYESDVDPATSRYYLEAHLLREALARSEWLKADSSWVVWKITGRYVIENIQKIVESQPKAFDVYMNFRNYPERVVDFYVAGFSRAGLGRLVEGDLDVYRSKDAGESILRRELDEGRFPELAVVKRFSVVPKISGIRGFDSRRYHGLGQTAKYYLRVVMNRVAWWVWI